MTNLIFSGTDKDFFDALTFDSAINAKWLFIDELVNTENNFKNMKFVLIYSAPEEFLMSGETSANTNLESIEQQWQPQIEQVTQFYLGNIKHAILVEQKQCKMNVTGFITLLESKLAVKKGACRVDESVNHVALHQQLSSQVKQLTIINNLTDSYSVQDTYENIVSAADLLTPDYDTSIEQRQVDCFNNYQQTLKEIQALSLTYDKVAEEKQQLIKEKTTLEDNLKLTTEECDLAALKIEQQQKEIEASAIKSKELTEQVHDQKSELKSSEIVLKEKAKDLAEHKAENELSLLQIQQLQEELEVSFLSDKKLTEQMGIQKSEAKAIAKQKDEEIAEHKADKEFSLLQIQQLQEELELIFINYKELTEQVEIQKSEAQATIKHKAEELTEFKAENELSLLQIQQLQEELEANFIQNKELIQQVGIQKSEVTSAESAVKQKSEELVGLKAENELSLLKIQQQQEELEFYHINYQSFSSNLFIKNKTAMNMVDKRFEKSLNLAKLLKA